MKRHRFTAIILVAALLMTFVSCTSGTNSEGSGSSNDSLSTASASQTQDESESGSDVVWDAYTPYKETVSFTKGVQKLSTISDNTYDDNPFTRYVKEQVNVETKIAWEVDPNNYNQKVSLCIASRDIPDIMVVDRKIFNQLRDNDLIEDMTEAYDKCISPFLREQYDTAGQRLFDEVTIDGRMMGIPSPSLGYCHNVMWIRQDWLDKLNLEVPNTLDEVIDVAEKFIETDVGGNGTLGITCPETVYGGYNSWGYLDTMFSACGSYPGWWIEKDGEPAYGSVQPETKAALSMFRDLYSRGILDKEFMTRTNDDRDGLLASSRIGIHFSVWWPSGGIYNVIENDPEANWTVVSAPTNSKGKLTTPENDPLQAILVVRKGYEHPEAIVKALNAGYDILRGNGETGKAANAEYMANGGLDWGLMPIPIEVNYANFIGVCRDEMLQALEADDPSVMKLVGYEAEYAYIKGNRESPRTDAKNYMWDLARIAGPTAALDSNLEFVPTAFFGTTETMGLKWATLEKMETETFLQIIVGEQPVDYFDTFVEQWYAAGGQEILDEIKEMNS